MDYITTDTISSTPVKCVGYECLTQGQVAAILAINIVISLVSIAGNSLVILSVLRTRSLRNQNNILLASLAVADLMMTTIGMPLHMVVGYGFKPRVDPLMCSTISMLISGMACVTILHITVIAFDRYLAVTLPLTYNQKMTSVRVAKFICFIWLAAVVLASVSFAWKNVAIQDDLPCDIVFVQAKGYRVYIMVLTVVSSFSMILYWYFRIFRIARGHRRQIRAVEIALEANGAARDGSSNTVVGIKANLRPAVTLIIILGFFVLAMFPGALLIVMDSFIPISKLEKTPLYMQLAITTLFSNSAINPIIYAARNREFRKAFVAQLNWIFRFKVNS